MYFILKIVRFEVFHGRLHRPKNFIFHFEYRFYFLLLVRILKVFFRFECLEVLSIIVRIVYFILKIDSLKFFTIIYIELHDHLPLSTWLLIHINTIVYNIQYDHHDQTIMYLSQHDHFLYSIRPFTSFNIIV